MPDEYPHVGLSCRNGAAGLEVQLLPFLEEDVGSVFATRRRAEDEPAPRAVLVLNRPAGARVHTAFLAVWMHLAAQETPELPHHVRFIVTQTFTEDDTCDALHVLVRTFQRQHRARGCFGMLHT